MFLMNKEVITIILLAICIVPIAVLIVTAIVVRIVKYNKNKESKLKDLNYEDINLEQQELFLSAYGGSSNISDVQKERNKITVVVVDYNKVNGEKLKEFGATGVLFVGNEVRCSYGDRANNIYELIKKV